MVQGVTVGTGSKASWRTLQGRKRDQLPCRGCRARRALHRVRGGRVQSDRQHTLCFRCHRSQQDRVRAKTRVYWPLLSEVAFPTAVPDAGLHQSRLEC